MDKSAAQRAGRALLRLMKGKGWKVRVWENMGWHYQVRLGEEKDGFSINVYPSFFRRGEKKTYHVLFGRGGSGGMNWSEYIGDNLPSRENPNDAVDDALRQARDYVEKRLAIVQMAERAAGLKAPWQAPVEGRVPCPHPNSNLFGGHVPGCYGPDDPRHTGKPWDGFNIYGQPYRKSERKGGERKGGE